MKRRDSRGGRSGDGQETPREVVRELLREHLLVGHPYEEITTPFRRAQGAGWQTQVGGIVEDEEGEHVLSHHQIAVRQGTNPRWIVFAIAEIVGEIRLEEAWKAGTPLPSEQICLYCGKELTGRMTRQYCNDRCRVADFRKRKAAEDLIATLQRSQLRPYWRAYHIKGPLLAMLQDIFVKYGEEAARAATDAVTWVLEGQGKPKPVRAKPVPRTGPLPRELVNLVAFADLHHVPQKDIALGIEKGGIPVVQGDWTTEDGTPIAWALDVFGRCDFYRYFHRVSTFTPCNACPHALV